jgi:hypothetical protein
MKPPRVTIPPDVIAGLAKEFASERLNGLRGGQAWFKAFKHRGEKIAHQHGQSWAELYAQIHREASVTIHGS